MTGFRTFFNLAACFASSKPKTRLMTRRMRRPRRLQGADSGYDGAGIGIYTPVKQPADGRELDADTASPGARSSGRATRFSVSPPEGDWRGRSATTPGSLIRAA
jgi:hypothetical protein